jgi:1-acyl-sn-glycerol-3-phosphate acyltransferase
MNKKPKGENMIGTIAFKIALAAWFALWAPLLVIALPSVALSRAFIVADAWGVLWLARIIAGIKCRIHDSPFSRGTAAGASIIAAKHMSILEVAALITHVPNAFFILKRELLWIPVYGWSFWRIGLQPVNRAKGATNMARLTAAVACKIARGMNLIIFPEGTRAKPGAPVRLKRGLLFIAESLKLPIRPVGADTGLYWPKRGMMRRGAANIWFEKPLPHDAALEEVAESIARHSA